MHPKTEDRKRPSFRVVERFDRETPVENGMIFSSKETIAIRAADRSLVDAFLELRSLLF